MRKAATILALSLGLLPDSYATTLDFEILGVKSDSGKIYIQLFKGESNYNAERPEAAEVLNARKGSVTVTFKDLEPGEYAVRYFHDEDNSGELDTNVFGVPSEGYGFSNNSSSSFGPASYQDMKFTVPENTAHISNQSTVNY